MDATITFPLFGDWLAINIPRYFTVFGFNIYYYGILVTLGFAMATLYLVKRSELFGLTTDNILDILLISVPCGLIGARIYFMLFNFSDFFGAGKWENILAFRDGGLAVYGGIIASGLVFIIYSRVKKIPLGSLLDAAGFGLFIGQAIGRWGNFINREAFGVETELPWKMGLTSWGVTKYYHPAFLYESLWNVAGLLIMHIFSKKSKTKYPGQYFLFYVAWYGLGRFMIEGLRVDSLFIPGTDFRVSQWLAAASFLAAVGLLLFNQFRTKTKLEENQEEIDNG
ncbi:MAG: prolipoprotein diacylglyceryl transferase [Oscillospiraceae bacterium]|nr:prolipoprotein diacylglyceryl transferase [Oscillospiraceae bacterium]